MSYIGKWVVCKRYPNRQNDYIGRIQCLFITSETENMVYGAETDDRGHWNYKYHKNEIVRVINKEEKDKILQTQRHTRNNYRSDLERLQKSYSMALQEIADGDIDSPMKSENIFMQSLPQAHCPYDDKLGTLISVNVINNPITGTTMRVKAKWACQICHSFFETEIPYLEILNME